MAIRKRSLASKKSVSGTKKSSLRGVARKNKKSAITPAGRKAHAARVRAGRKGTAAKRGSSILKRVSSLMD